MSISANGGPGVCGAMVGIAGAAYRDRPTSVVFVPGTDAAINFARWTGPEAQD